MESFLKKRKWDQFFKIGTTKIAITRPSHLQWKVQKETNLMSLTMQRKALVLSIYQKPVILQNNDYIPSKIKELRLIVQIMTATKTRLLCLPW